MDSPTIRDCSLETAARTWKNAMAIELHDDGRRRCAGGSPRPGSPVRRRWRRYACCGRERLEARAQAELEEDVVDLHVNAWHSSLAADPLLTAQIRASDRRAWG